MSIDRDGAFQSKFTCTEFDATSTLRRNGKNKQEPTPCWRCNKPTQTTPRIIGLTMGPGAMGNCTWTSTCTSSLPFVSFAQSTCLACAHVSLPDPRFRTSSGKERRSDASAAPCTAFAGYPLWSGRNTPFSCGPPCKKGPAELHLPLLRALAPGYLALSVLVVVVSWMS